ncbi:hypothetical protein FOCC_FOCC014036 [Frankliniella occidentalis]|nr:hypothetical protein FOCC_FOCC014036 [Frankliniella occidentalis]
MLCAYGFATDERGCPLCRCYDPCSEVSCGGALTCQLEEPVSCTRPPCLPVPTCKKGRSLDNVCPAGAPLTMPGSGVPPRPFLCGLGAGQPRCPPLFECSVQPGECPTRCIEYTVVPDPTSIPLSTSELDMLPRPGIDIGLSTALYHGPWSLEILCFDTFPHSDVIKISRYYRVLLHRVCGRTVVDVIVSRHEAREAAPPWPKGPGRALCSAPGCAPPGGNDYGVCCPGAARVDKAGACPARGEHLTRQCGPGCRQDQDCPGPLKCCDGDVCGGRTCTPPTNLTECRQLRQLSVQLSVSEREGRGYVPQCDPVSGAFRPRQCSRNGRVCWCVDRAGNKLPNSMGPSSKVRCLPHAALDEARASVSGRAMGSMPEPPRCDSPPGRCAQVCELGFRVDPDGCPTCECDDPCAGAVCGSGEECFAAREPDCDGPFCSATPICRPAPTAAPTAAPTTPPTTPPTTTGQPDAAADASPDASVDASADTVAVDNPTERSASADLPSAEANSSESSGPDADSAEAALDEDGHPATMCEYLRDFRDKMEGTRDGMSLALPPPTCRPDGSFNDTQCAAGECWCVDSFGTEIPQSRIAGPAPSPACSALRESLDCLDLTCRLGCEFGFTLSPDTRCPLCECRDPCAEAKCGPNAECHVVEVACDAEYCPPVPACEYPEKQAVSLFIDGILNFQKFPIFGNAKLSPVARLPKKPGQCPYLVPVGAGSCDYQCRSDYNCNETAKCCSNGCGTQCMQPVVMTECQHRRAILQHESHESGIPAGRLWVPRCRERDGAYESVQCHPGKGQCWCVDAHGQELPGTRTDGDQQPDCRARNELVELLDARGCPTCRCRDPCQELQCRGEGEACRMVQVQCADPPCHKVPMCLPHRENPCLTGQPLESTSTPGGLFRCGPSGDSCPASHKCELSPLGEYAVCCQKPRDVCFEPVQAGPCEPGAERWHFNPERNSCQLVPAGQCGAQHNSFPTKEMCNKVCPVLSQCERLREKNQKAADKYKKWTFIPRCSAETGAWLPLQCLTQVGVCWCVAPDGQPIKGTLTRDPKPSFAPTQCLPKDDPEGECWCVDEAGNQLVNTTTFKRGAKICLPTPIEAVEVSLGFLGEPGVVDARAELLVLEAVRGLLAGLDQSGPGGPGTARTATRSEGLRVTLGPGRAVATFSLHGPGKVDTAFHLEEMVKSGALSVGHESGSAMVADITQSRFSHRVAQLDADDEGGRPPPSRVIALQHREIVSESTVSEVTSYHTAILVLSAASAFVIVVLAVLAALYRRRMIVAAKQGGQHGQDDDDDRFGLGPGNEPVYVVRLPSPPPLDKHGRVLGVPLGVPLAQEDIKDIKA